MKTIKTITLAVGSLFLVPTLSHGKEFKPSQIGMAMMRLNASPFSQAEPTPYPYSGNVWAYLRKDFKIQEVNQSLIRTHESKFATNAAYFNRTLQRSKPYLYHISNEVKKRGMPAEIALLPFIESAYVTKARSHVGASGLWQFMPATGRHYGLEQTSLYDGRHDVYASTDAALNYLQYLHSLFGDWSLALAAYNWGEGNVSRAIRKSEAAGLPPTYENLKMPNETRNYVPKLLAVRNLVNNPQIFGLSLPDIDYKPYFKTVTVDSPIDISAAARLANISESEFLSLNPAFKTPVFIPKTTRKMLLPVTAAKSFEDNYRKSDAKSLLSWDIYTPAYPTSLDDISIKTGLSVSELKRLNNLSSNNLAAGRSILVSKNTALGLNNPTAAFAKADFDPVPDTYVEQKPLVLNRFAGSAVTTIAKTSFVPTAQDIAVKANTQTIATTGKSETDVIADLLKNKAVKTNVVAKTDAGDVQQTAVPVVAKAVVQAAPQSEATQLKTENPNLKTSGSDSVAQIIAYQPIDTETTHTESVKKQDAVFVTATVDTSQSLLLNNDDASKMADTHSKTVGKNAFSADPIQLLVEESQAQIRAENQSQSARVAVSAPLAETINQTQMLEIKKQHPQAAVSTGKTKQQDFDRNIYTHKVTEGDTLYNIAKRYNMNVADLIAENRLKGSNIRVGQILQVAKSKNKVAEKTAVNNQNSVRKIPASYIVRKGDTLQTIADRYKLKIGDIQKLNKGKGNLKAGQTIKLTPS